MITNVTIKNYRSIFDASVSLAPFTLLIGANGTGKSNFLRLLREVSDGPDSPCTKHVNYPSSDQLSEFENHEGKVFSVRNRSSESDRLPELENVSVFSLNPANAGESETLVEHPVVHEDGSGVVQVLDSLKTGDREDLFDTVEATLREYIPETEKLSFVPGQTVKQLQVRERHLAKPIPVSRLSDGTRLTLILLTIMFQENPPSLICIEEIDRSLHPRLFGRIVRLCLDMAEEENMPQIIATTHNPYLLDQFRGNEDAVVIVEKEKGETTFTTLEERLRHLEPHEEPLGALWYSGFVGGVPGKGE